MKRNENLVCCTYIYNVHLQLIKQTFNQLQLFYVFPSWVATSLLFAIWKISEFCFDSFLNWFTILTAGSNILGFLIRASKTHFALCTYSKFRFKFPPDATIFLRDAITRAFMFSCFYKKKLKHYCLNLLLDYLGKQIYNILAFII